jgi:hypothetical protein
MNTNTVSNLRRLPDPEVCRIRCLEQVPDLSKCLVEDPDGCEFAVRFGSGDAVLCVHPDRLGFEKTTQTEHWKR